MSPTPEELQQAAAVLGVSVDDLLVVDRQAAAEGEAIMSDRQSTEAAVAMSQAVAEGAIEPAEAAELLRAAGDDKAWLLFTEGWRQSEAAEQEMYEREALSLAGADDYIEHVRQQEVEEIARLKGELQRLETEKAKSLIGELGDRFHEYVATTPGAHQTSEDVLSRLQQLVVEAAGIPKDAAGQEQMIAQATHDVALRENISGQLTEQVSTEWHAYKTYGGSQSRYQRDTGGRLSAAEAKQYEAEWKAKRLNELAGDVTPEAVEAARVLPPTPQEIAAAEAAKYVERQQKSTTHQKQVAEIAERGRAVTPGDHGEHMTANRTAYREAVERAEREAMYGTTEIRSGYGPDAVREEPKDQNGQLDEFGGAFPGYRRPGGN